MYIANVCSGENMKLWNCQVRWLRIHVTILTHEKMKKENKTKSMNSQKFLILFEIKDNIEQIYVFKLGK